MQENFLLNKTTIFAAGAAVLLGLSAAGSTRAAISATTNEAIIADFETSNVAVSISENGKNVENGTLLAGIDDFCIGKTYDEVISFTNGEDYDAYARVIITKSWYDGERKDQTLNPALIDLTLSDEDAWIMDEKASTPERMVYYYKKPVAASDSVDITDKLTVNQVITEIVTKSKVEAVPQGTIQTIYNYDGKSFSIDVLVDEIQTHNAFDAARASWGVYLDMDKNGTIQGIFHEEASKNAVLKKTIPVITSVTYDGKTLSNEKADLTEILKNVQPGDTASVCIDLYNQSSNKTYYYLTASIIKSLEDSSNASDGAYTCSLVYQNEDGKETVLYNNDTVGGENKKNGVGLNQVQITDEDSYVYLDGIPAGGKGKIFLNITLDGTTQNNSYMNTLAKLKLRFAVENAAASTTRYENRYIPGEVVTVKNPDTVVTILEELVLLSPKTGDLMIPIGISIAAFAGGVILLVWAVILMKKRNEEA